MKSDGGKKAKKTPVNFSFADLGDSKDPFESNSSVDRDYLLKNLLPKANKNAQKLFDTSEKPQAKINIQESFAQKNVFSFAGHHQKLLSLESSQVEVFSNQARNFQKEKNSQNALFVKQGLRILSRFFRAKLLSNFQSLVNCAKEVAKRKAFVKKLSLCIVLKNLFTNKTKVCFLQLKVFRFRLMISLFQNISGLVKKRKRKHFIKLKSKTDFLETFNLANTSPQTNFNKHNFPIEKTPEQHFMEELVSAGSPQPLRGCTPDKILNLEQLKTKIDEMAKKEIKRMKLATNFPSFTNHKN